MILKSIHLLLFIISFLFIGCLGVDKSSDTETSSNDTITIETDSTKVTVRVLLGAIAIDSIHVTVSVDSTIQTLPISFGSQISGEASFTFSIPSSGTNFEVFYQCYRLEAIIGSKKETLELPNDTQVTSTIDAYPITITLYNDTTLEVGDKLSLNPDINDDSDNINITYDFFGAGTFSSGYSAYFDSVGEFTVTLKAFDGYHTISETFVVTVIDPVIASPNESSSSFIAPKELSSSLNNTVTESSSITPSSNTAHSSFTSISSTSVESSSTTDASSNSLLKEYSVTLIQPEGGTISGPETVIENGSITLSPISNSGYTFTGYVISSGSGTLLGHTISNITSNLEITAIFTPKTYSISITSTGFCGSITNSSHYTYTVNGTNTTLHTLLGSYCKVDFSSADVIFEDSIITDLSQTRYSKQGTVLNITVAFSDLTKPSANIDIQCFLDGVNQNSCSGGFGSTSEESFTLYEDANSRALSAQADPGFTFDGFSEIQNVTLVDHDVSYITAGTQGIVKANFSRDQYIVAINTQGGGSVSKSSETLSYNIQKTIQVVPTPQNSSYSFDKWLTSGNCSIIGSIKTPTSFTGKCTGSGSFVAIFEPISVTGVTISASPNLVLYGSSQTVSYTISPPEAANKSVSWRSLNSSILSVNENGVITALDIGTGKIEVTTNDGAHTDIAILTIDSFVDNRQTPKVYKAVRIGTQVWMGENLNYSTSGSYCYDNSSYNCTKYGRLYNWIDLTDTSSATDAVPSGIQGICLENWHVPSEGEWQILSNYITTHSIYDVAKSLKAELGWSNNGNGKDENGFTALPGGYGGGASSMTFNSLQSWGNWWSTTIPMGSQCRGTPRYYSIKDTDDLFYETCASKAYYYSARCVKD